MMRILFLWCFVFWSQALIAQSTIEHYVFFNIDRHRIQEPSFLEESALVGAQLKYHWRELEPQKGQYNFQGIEEDLTFLSQHGKKLFIQIQDVSFDTAIVTVPEYLLEDTSYHGGVAIQYLLNNKDQIIRQDGYVARRWDPNVAQRFYKLLKALGQQFDGRIAGINLPESIIDFGESGSLYPSGFSPAIYRDALLEQMKIAKTAFPNTVFIQYANFMPGEWLPWEDKGYLKSLYEFAWENDIGMGGPDIKIYKKAQMNHSYKFLKASAGKIKTGIAVQWGNYEEINPKTQRQVRIPEIIDFGQTEVQINYIFWCTQEPYYSKQLLPLLQKRTSQAKK